MNIIKISITDHNSQVAVSTAKNVHGLYCILPLGRSVMSTTEKRKSSSNTKIRLHGDRMVQACFFLLYFSPLPAYPGPPESDPSLISSLPQSHLPFFSPSSSLTQPPDSPISLTSPPLPLRAAKRGTSSAREGKPRGTRGKP